MSEVGCVKGVGSEGGAGDTPEKGTLVEQVAVVGQLQPGGLSKMVAPALRVEELRDDDGHSSGTYVSEEEGALSHGEGGLSDNERNMTKSPQGEFHPPDDDLKERIIKQVEFYFSDANILKDAFLLKHVRRNKQGYVSLKLITSFKKVKSLTKDYRVVAFGLRQSNQLEVNEEGTKVRRTEPLPDYDETTPSRTVVAVNLSQESPTIESVAELFKACGEIALIRILRPGKGVPQDVKKHINKHPEIGTTVCAVVEFEDHHSAKMACDTLTDKDDWRKGMRVVLLASKKAKDQEKSKKKHDEEKEKNSTNANDKYDDRSGDDRNTDGRDSDGEKGEKKRRKRGGKRKNSRVDELIVSENPCYSSDSGGECLETTPPRNRSASAGTITDSLTTSSKKPQRNSLSPKPDHNRLTPSNTPHTSPSTSPRSSPRGSPNASRRKLHGRSPLATELSPGSSPRPSPRGSPESRRRSMNLEDKGDTGSSPSSPWVQRRLKAQQAGQIQSTSPGASPRLGRRLPDGTYDKSISPRMAHEDRIVRQPRGPDGTKGFGMGRGKPRSETM